MSSRDWHRLRFGAAYYTEYSPYERLQKDLDLMAEARFSVIRVGESVWSTWEPEDGVFDLDWLQPVLDGAQQRRIGVILGTPTYAIPPWMQRKYPEVMAERATGEPIPYGHRQNVDYTHPAFRHLAERIVRKIVERYARHPAVIGYQVDNEPGVELLHNRSVFEGFVDDLRDRYGTVDELNTRWGLTYWSHRISRWSELWTPDGNTTPAYDLAWRRYQARLTADFIRWQAELVRSLARDDQFITTCIALDRPAQDVVEVGRGLDITAVNLYYPMQDGLALPSPDHTIGKPHWIPGDGTWWLYHLADTARGIRQAPFLVTETNASSISGPDSNFGAYDGQWRQAIWAMVSRGARMVEYWHWHTNHFGFETYWGGVLGHSMEPGRCYHELARTGAELERTQEQLAELRPDEPVAFLVSPASRWALEFQPALARASTNEPDTSSYNRTVFAFYRSFFEVGADAAIVHPDQLAESTASELVERWPVLVVPALYVAGEELLELLVAYADAGGHLVVTFRTGYADEDAQPWPEVMPGRLAPAVGATYLEFTNLANPVQVRGADEQLDTGGGHALGWADALELDAAEALAFYEHPHLQRWPAIVTNEHGRGRVTYVGTLPDATLGRSLATWVLDTSVPDDGWHGLAPSVRVSGATAAAGRLRFVHNWSWDEVAVFVPVDVEDLLDGTTVAAGGELRLGPWDVRIVVER